MINLIKKYTYINSEEELEKYCLITGLYNEDIKNEPPLSLIIKKSYPILICVLSNYNWDYAITESNSTDFKDYLEHLINSGFVELTMDEILKL